MVAENAGINWGKFAGAFFRHLSTFTAVFALLFMFAKPWTVQFIKDSIADEKFVTQQQLSDIQEKQANLENQLSGAQNQLSAAQSQLNSLSNKINETARDVEFIKKLQAEARADTKAILSRLGGGNSSHR